MRNDILTFLNAIKWEVVKDIVFGAIVLGFLLYAVPGLALTLLIVVAGTATIILGLLLCQIIGYKLRDFVYNLRHRR